MGRDPLRVRDRLALAVQHPAPAGAAGQRHRLPHPQRVRLPHPGARPRGGHRGARRQLHGPRRLLLHELGRPLRQVDDQDPRPRQGARDHQLRRPARARGRRPRRQVRRRPRLGLEDPGRLPPPARPGAASCGSTTSSSSTSATRPTWTSSGSASSRGRASPTSPSRRWSPASRSTCSVPTRSSSASPAWRSTPASPTPSPPATSTRPARSSRAARAGEAWIASFQESAEPWFNFSTGSGFYHSDKIWIENVEHPVRLHRQLHQQAAERRRPRPADGGHPGRARPHRQRVRRAAARATPTARRSRASWAWRASCSPTWRTTTSTSSTGATR